jgi:hypothetical protein
MKGTRAKLRTRVALWILAFARTTNERRISLWALRRSPLIDAGANPLEDLGPVRAGPGPERLPIPRGTS